MDVKFRLPAGTIRYREAGSGPAIVFVHGYLVDGRLWDGVVDALSDRFRCIVPDLPFGAHQVAMAPDATLDPARRGDDRRRLHRRARPRGRDPGRQRLRRRRSRQVLVARRPARVARLVLTNCDTHENFPPGIFKAMPPLAKLPGGMQALARRSGSRRSPAPPSRPFAKSGPPADLVAVLDRPPHSPTGRSCATSPRSPRGMDKRHTLAAAAALRGTRFPLLLAWAPGDRYFPIRYAERLAAEVGGAKLVAGTRFGDLRTARSARSACHCRSPTLRLRRRRPREQPFAKSAKWQLFRPTGG